MKPTLTTLAAGVRIRHRDTRDTLQIEFQYRGVRCVEGFPGLDAGKKADREYVIKLRAEILSRIERRTFRYGEYFPNSPRARRFGETVSAEAFAEYARAWLADVRRTHPHSTVRAYARPLEKLWIPAIGGLRLADVTPEHLREVLRGLDITMKTARNYLLPVRQVFDQAVDDDIVPHNPVARLKLKRLIPEDRRESAYEVDPYSEDEIEQLLGGFAEHRPGWLNYFTFMFFTGARPSEAYGITWPNVDLQKSQARIDRAIVERLEKGPKTRASRRVISLLPRARAALVDQQAATRLAGAEVFWNPRTWVPIVDYEESAAVWNWVHKKTGVRRRNQYQTRHSYASNLLSQGANFLWVAEQLGHKDLEMVMRVYAVWIEQGKDRPAGQVTYGQPRTVAGARSA